MAFANDRRLTMQTKTAMQGRSIGEPMKVNLLIGKAAEIGNVQLQVLGAARHHFTAEVFLGQERVFRREDFLDIESAQAWSLKVADAAHLNPQSVDVIWEDLRPRSA